MRARLQRKLITAAVMATAVSVTICGASYLDHLMPSTSPVWIIAVILMGVGSMLGVSWICDECDGYFDRRAKDQSDVASGDEHNGHADEAWQFDSLDELRAEVYRVDRRPRLPESRRWSLTRTWRGQ